MAFWLALVAAILLVPRSTGVPTGSAAGSDDAGITVPPRCTSELLADVEGFMVDLDGTMYGDLSSESRGLDAFVDGATALHGHFVAQRVPYVYLSDSGAKGARGVAAKFRALGLASGVGGAGLHAWTAADGIAMYLTRQAVPGARILVLDSVSYFDGELDSCLRVIRRYAPDPVPWELSVDLGEQQAKEWAARARAGAPVFVVYCADGEASTPDGGPPGPPSFSAGLMTRAVWLLANGATLVGSAPDDFSAQMDPAFPQLRLWLPGPGPWLSWLRQASGLRDASRARVVGKGGGDANEFMFGEALERLRLQNLTAGKQTPKRSLDPRHLAMVGDTIATDIAGGQAFGAKTVFLTRTGFNRLEDLRFYPGVSPTCHLPSVRELAALLPSPRAAPRRGEARPATSPSRPAGAGPPAEAAAQQQQRSSEYTTLYS